jgi:ribosomal-protein-alanine N-acetyltransferase
MAWVIREGTHADLPTLFALEQLCFDDPWSLAMLESDFVHRCSRYRLLEYRDPLSPSTPRMVGFCLYWQVVDECHLMQIAVHPDEQRQGLGRKLMKDLLQQAHDNQLVRIFLEVRASNQAARALYKSMNFHEIGVRSCYYSEPPEDGIVLECRLPSLAPLRK